jgi:metal-responsive CopG/Arc/MetJ family transcriptional regulator
MQKVLISVSDSLASRLKAVIPDRQRSKVISQLIEKELKKREEALYRCAVEVEKDEALNAEMKEWEVTVADGINHESW